MKTCIIFGGYGYIGRHLAVSLKNIFKVYSFGNSTYSEKNRRTFNYNLKNFEKKIKKISPSVIFFLSGNSYPINSLDNHLYDIERSNTIIQNFLTALKNINFKGKIIYTSSIAVYGKDKNFKKNYVYENSELNPKNYYGLSKVMAEQQFIYFHKNFGLKIYILRLSSIFGMDLEKQVIYKIIKLSNIKKLKKITLNGKITDSRQFIFIEDLIKIFLLLINNKKNFLLLNVSNGKKYKISDIISYIHKKMNVKKTIIYKKQSSPVFPVLKNNLLMKETKNFKFENFNKSIDKTISYWTKKR
jgi:UDP-glucose 4-epimerase